MVMYGSGNGDGNRHNHDDLPILLVGKGGSTIEAGRHTAFAKRPEIPLTNLFLRALREDGGAPGEGLRRQHRRAEAMANFQTMPPTAYTLRKVTLQLTARRGTLITQECEHLLISREIIARVRNC